MGYGRHDWIRSDQMRILIVEDESRIRAFLARAFEAEGFPVDVVEDGESGLSHALTGSYDLVILDLLLPGRDGLDVLRQLHRARSELPVLILSARGDLSTKLQSFELGAVDYVAKPFSLDELLARVRVQLRRVRITDDGKTITVGHLALDLASRQARFGGAVAELSDREFRLLHFLMQHVGEVISRERLLAEVWGYDFDPGSNVVDVCVRRLRRRLGPDAPIETVRNAGYRAAA
jgi:DNA-binding response OmpR family regulator